MSTHTLSINEDEKCRNCGKGGAVNGGICLTCLNKKLKNMEDKKMAKFINEQILGNVSEVLRLLFEKHMEEMDAAYADSDEEEDNKLAVSIGLSFEEKPDGVKVKTSFSFTAKKIKEITEFTMNPAQPGLPFNQKGD